MTVACAIRSRRFASDPDLHDTHIDSCLRCQAEAVRYRTLIRSLGALQGELITAPPGLVGGITGLPIADAATRKTSGREAVVATAGLAAVAGAIALWRRSMSA